MAENVRRFHREVYFEPTAKVDIERFFEMMGQLTYSRHAKLQTVEDRYGRLMVLTPANLKAENVFEYYRSNNAISKVVLRITGQSESVDYCYSVSADGVVVTAWANHKSDTHETLDKSLYQSEPQGE